MKAHQAREIAMKVRNDRDSEQYKDVMKRISEAAGKGMFEILLDAKYSGLMSLLQDEGYITVYDPDPRDNCIIIRW